MSDFNAKDSTIFGAIAAVAWAVRAAFQYLGGKSRQKTKEAEIELFQKIEEKIEEKVMSEENNPVEKKGIESIIANLDAGKMLSLYIISKAKDGVQVQDGIDLVSKILLDPEFRGKIEHAIHVAKQIPEEAKDIDLPEAIQLGKYIFDSIPEYINASKQP
jgi:hypothetical protein